MILQPDLNLDFYMGLWWEVARIPSQCDFRYGITCIEYKRKYAFSVKSYNRCYLPEINGSWECIRYWTGNAQISPKNHAEWNMTYPSEPIRSDQSMMSLSIASLGNYLIHSTDYTSYSLVGSPNKDTLQLLSRNSKMSLSLYKHALELVKALGYDISKLITNTQMLKRD
jgi:lipocalin